MPLDYVRMAPPRTYHVKVKTPGETWEYVTARYLLDYKRMSLEDAYVLCMLWSEKYPHTEIRVYYNDPPEGKDVYIVFDTPQPKGA